MTVTSLIVVAAALGWAALPEAPVATPEWLPKAVEEVDDAMRTVESGRRLKAAAADLPVEPMLLPPGGPSVVYKPGERPFIAVDPERARLLKGVEFELALARERARASKDVGVRLVESEQAAEQLILEYALDRAQVSEEFGGLLSRATRRVDLGRKPSDEALAAEGEGPVADLRLPAKDPDREAELLSRFGKDPEHFYWTVERELLHAPGAVRLVELESFLWSFAERLDRAVCPPPGRYCKLDGRLVNPDLVAAARATLGAGGLDRLREVLGTFQGDEAERVRARVEKWLKKH